jgi:hypothetical protein
MNSFIGNIGTLKYNKTCLQVVHMDEVHMVIVHTTKYMSIVTTLPRLGSNLHTYPSKSIISPSTLGI